MLGLGTSLTKFSTVFRLLGSTGPINSPPSITGVPTISGVPEVGQTLTITPASTVTGTPTPVRTIELYKNGLLLTTVPSLTYVVTTDDYGATFTVRQVETNDEGFDEAFSADFVIAPFSPADLFTGSELGGFWDISQTSSLWQDTAATTPITATGQSVARVDDLSGNGNHWLQATAGSRPLYQADGAIEYLDLDGTDDSMSTNNITGLMREGTTMVIATRIASGGVSTAYNAVFGAEGVTNNFMRIAIRNDVMRKQALTRLLANGRAQVAGPTDAANGATPADTYQTLTLTFTDAEQNIARDGSFLTAVGHGWSNTDQVNASVTTGLAAFGVRRRIIAALYITRSLTAGELTLVHAWMAARLNP